MKGDPLLWIAALAIIGLLLVLLASAVLKTRAPRERERVDKLVDQATKKNKQGQDRP
jgi:di/tricarboxylate transporter